MNKLIIKNVGPIKNVEIDLNRVNVFMGPQSSGKSTIAKIISYCQWVEKRFLLDGEYKHKFSDQFINFHRIDENYFSSNSLFIYESEFTYISYKGKNHEEKIEKKENNFKYKKSNNIYIPAERNFVSVIPNLGKYKESNDNIMSFLYDWYDIKRTYTEDKALPILNLGINFYHEEDNDSDKLLLDKVKKKISLKNASSGLQSIVPLTMIIEYLTGEFYNKDASISANEKKALQSLISTTLDSYMDSIKISKDDLNELKQKEHGAALMKLVRNKYDYHFSSFIIEEPEQNLFPETQRDLMYFLFDKLTNTGRNHSLTLTTHSPYILYALNNCMLGYLVKDKLIEEEKAELPSKISWINPESVSVWEIDKETGTVKSIKNEKTGTVSKHYFNKVMNDVMDEYYELLNHIDL